MSESVVDIKGVSRSFGKKIALDEVDLSVAKGSVVGLVGDLQQLQTTIAALHVPIPQSTLAALASAASAR